MTVLPVTQEGMNNMRGLMSCLFMQGVLPIIFMTLIVGSLSGRELVEGSITYISRDQAYIDLGKKSGVQIGDSVQVYRDDVLLGVARISQSSGASSAMEALEPADIPWDIGDNVALEVTLAQIPQTPTIASSEEATKSKPMAQVFLDSSSYAPRTPSNMTLDSDRFSPAFTGYISTRVSDRGGDTSGVRETTGSIYGQFKILDLGIRHLDVSTYVRSNRSFRDSSSHTSIYSIMMSYDDPSSRFSYLMGRMYHPQFSMLGTIDGLGMTWRSNRRVLAVAAGLMSNVNDIQDQVQRNKFGILDEEKFKWGKMQFGVIGETESGAFSRNYLLLGSTAKIGSKLRLRGYSEFDLDLQDQSQFQRTLSLTRFRASVSWRPWRSFISSTRYSYRENVVDLLDTAQTEYEKAARHTFNSNLSFMFGSGLTLTGQASFRGDHRNRQIKIFGLSMNHRKFTTQAISLNAGGMLMLSYLSEGGRVYASLGKAVLPWLDVDLYDEIFLYKILGESSFRTRHLPEVSFSAKVPGLQRLRVRTRFEIEKGELLYRISLSASRQF